MNRKNFPSILLAGLLSLEGCWNPLMTADKEPTLKISSPQMTLPADEDDNGPPSQCHLAGVYAAVLIAGSLPAIHLGAAPPSCCSLMPFLQFTSTPYHRSTAFWAGWSARVST